MLSMKMTKVWIRIVVMVGAEGQCLLTVMVTV
jgi:hypothetical protein